MDIFMKALGALISLGFIFFGYRFIFKPRNSIQSLQRIKYKTTSEVGKRELLFSRIFGTVLALIGIYYLIIVILSIIYPA